MRARTKTDEFQADSHRCQRCGRTLKLVAEFRQGVCSRCLVVPPETQTISPSVILSSANCPPLSDAEALLNLQHWVQDPAVADPDFRQLVRLLFASRKAAVPAVEPVGRPSKTIRPTSPSAPPGVGALASWTDTFEKWDLEYRKFREDEQIALYQIGPTGQWIGATPEQRAAHRETARQLLEVGTSHAKSLSSISVDSSEAPKRAQFEVRMRILLESLRETAAL